MMSIQRRVAGSRAWRSRLAREAVWVLVSQAGAVLIGAIGSLFIAAALGPAHYGRLSIALAVSSLATGLGLFRLDHHLMSALHRSEPAEEYERALGSALVLCGALATVIAALGAGFSPDEGPERWVWVIIACEVASNPWNLARPALVVAGRSRVLALTSVASRLFWLLVAVPAVTLVDPRHAYVIVLAGWAAGNGAAGLVLSRVAGLPLIVRPRWRAMSTSLREAAPLATAGISSVVYGRADQLLIALFLGPVSVGRYALAVRLAEFLRFIPSAIQTAGTSSLVAALRRGGLRGQVLLLSWAAGVPVFVFGGLLGGLGDAFVRTVAGEAYGGLRWIIAGLIVVELAVVASSGATTALLVMNRRRPIGVAAIVTLVGTVLLDVCLIPTFGIAGAAYASAIGYTLGAIYVWLAYDRCERRLGRVESAEACVLR